MKNKKATWIPVVTGLIRKSGQVLVGQRPEEGTLPGQWEFPGGKIEIGEDPIQALKRELHEELGIQADIGPLRMASTHAYGDKGVVLLFYDVGFWKGEIKDQHHHDLRWVYPSELKELTIPEANRTVLEQLLKILDQ